MSPAREDRGAAPLGAAFRAQLVAVYGRWHRAEGSAHSPDAWFEILCEATAQEAATVQEMAALSAFAFVERVDACTAEANEALRGPLACDVMQLCLDTLTDEALATPASANAYLRHLRHSWRSRRGMRGKLVMFPLRAALTGTMVGPCLGVVTSLLGRERCCGRLEARLRDATQG